MISNLLIKQIIIMFILMGIGFVLYKVKFISDQGAKDISKILLYVVIPIVIIKNFMIENSSENITALIQSFIITAIAMSIAIIVAYLIFGKKNGIANFSTSFSNAGFIGIPLVSAVLGERAVFYISMMIVMVNILQWTYGIWIMSGDTSVIKPKKIISNPTLIAVMIGLIVFALQIKLPSIVINIFDTVSGLNTPLAMMVSGVYLAQSNLLAMLKKTSVYTISLFRLVLIPIITIFAFKLLPFGTFYIKMAILIAAACPVGSNVAIFANLYNKDYVSAVEQVCMSTLLCLITLPLVVSLANTIL